MSVRSPFFEFRFTFFVIPFWKWCKFKYFFTSKLWQNWKIGLRTDMYLDGFYPWSKFEKNRFKTKGEELEKQINCSKVSASHWPRLHFSPLAQRCRLAARRSSMVFILRARVLIKYGTPESVVLIVLKYNICNNYYSILLFTLAKLFICCRGIFNKTLYQIGL